MRKSILFTVIIFGLLNYPNVSSAEKKQKKDPLDYVKQATGGVIDIAQQAGKDVKNGLDNTVGVGLKTGTKAIEEGAKLPVKGVQELGKGAGNLVQNTVSETSKLLEKGVKEIERGGKKVERGLSDIGEYIEENPIEAAIVIVGIAYGGYLVYTGDFVLQVKLGELTYTVVEGGAAAQAVGGAIVSGVTVVGAQGVDESQRVTKSTDAQQAQTPDMSGIAGPPTMTYEFENIPQRASGEIPQRQMHDGEKVHYAMDVNEFIKKYPVEMYKENGVPSEATVQEAKILDALVLLRTLPISEGDKLVEQRDEKNAVTNVIGSGAKELGQGNLPGAATEVTSELALQGALPSVTSDATLLGQSNIKSLEEALNKELGKYLEMRSDMHKATPSDDQIKEDIESANSQTDVVLPTKPESGLP